MECDVVAWILGCGVMVVDVVRKNLAKDHLGLPCRV